MADSTTPDQWRAEAARLERQAAEYDTQAVMARQAAVLLRSMADLQERVLHTEDESNTVGTMHASSNALRSSAQLDAHREHRFVAMLVKRKITVATVSDFLTTTLKRPVPRNTVQSWYKKPDDAGYRSIPEDAAKALRDEYGVPIGAWHRVRPTESR